MYSTIGGSHFFPLTSLQIGLKTRGRRGGYNRTAVFSRDLRSYLSTLTLFLAPKSKKFFILVDNTPWLMKKHSKHAQLWQLMVTKSRSSPFANTRARRKNKEFGRKPHLSGSFKHVPNKKLKLKRLLSVFYGAIHKKPLLPVNELHQTLYGFILFEVAWKNVHGINYLNELQNDTSLALEVWNMKKWEFDNMEQASSSISSWFDGIGSEGVLLKDYLNGTCGSHINKGHETPPLSQKLNFHDGLHFNSVEEVFHDAYDTLLCDSSCSENESCDEQGLMENLLGVLGGENVCKFVQLAGRSNFFTTPSLSPCKRRKLEKSPSSSGEDSFGDLSQKSHEFAYSADHGNENIISDATQYQNTFILLRFNDPNLPFRLRDIIMSDLHLLTLLESGLPSWAIFLQSYPIFCHLYSPWMRPLARISYIMISIVTVLIGFYDLYKNVPILKLTAAQLCGPLFEWIESLEMVSRIKYLGTILFLHNFEKAFRWLLLLGRAIWSLLYVVVTPISDPLVELFGFILPTLNGCFETVCSICSAIWIILESIGSTTLDIVQLFLWPMNLAVSTVWYIAINMLYPAFCALWFVLFAPVRLVISMTSFIALSCYNLVCLMGTCWVATSRIFSIASTAEQRSRSEISILHSLGNVLFSQIFRAIRSILNVFANFCLLCIRHRISWKQRIGNSASTALSLKENISRKEVNARTPVDGQTTYSLPFVCIVLFLLIIFLYYMVCK